ncbi:MAG: PQQ-binding-like beta-propeller repeat protein [Zavarzinella sp.]
MALLLSASADNWPQWRGIHNDGISKEKGIVSEWSETKNIVWSLTLPGMGGATPAIWEDKIFLTSEAGVELIAMCISTDGKVLWQKSIGKTTNKARSDEGNGASASPTTDGKHVWFFVGSGELVCFDFSGKEIWNFNVQQRYNKFQIQFGMHSTPVLHDGKLYLQLLHTKHQDVVCVDAATGKDIWKIDRKSDGRAECEHSYASPMMWSNGKDAYLVTHGNDYTIAHDLKDGSEIWRLGGLNPKSAYNATLRFVATPLVTPDLIVVPTAKNGPVVGVKPTAKGTFSAGSEHELWRRAKETPDVPSPLLADGLVYLTRETGVLNCVDAKTGEQLYSQRVNPGRHRASPVYVDGKIIVASRTGQVGVVKAGKSFELISENRLDDDFSASPAIANGRIYLRGYKKLYAIGSK